MEEISELQQELRREIEREAELLLADARRRGETLLSETEGLAERRLTEAGRRIELKADARRRQARARARQEGRIALLRTRRTEIEKVLGAVRQRLLEWRQEGGEAYGDLLWSFYLQGRKILPAGPVKVIVDPCGSACRKRLEKEDDVEVAIDERLQGLIMESARARQRCDFTLETLLTNVRAWREAEIAEILFEEQDEAQGW